jgi:tetratricopeptide (TPR) repeat protein
MGKKNYKKDHSKHIPVQPAAQEVKKIQALSKSENKYSEYFIWIVLLFTAALYIPSLFNGWILNWDDGGYIQEHVLVHKLSWDNFITIFNPTTFYKGNYHPLTTFFYAIEYSIVGEKAFLYHLNNLIFHLLNVFLVYKFIKFISKNLNVAVFVALFFGIHPMHIESVAWIAERKDVLYTFFFMLSLIYYYYYFSNKVDKTKNYLVSLLFFFLSLLSKSAAVCLPVVLLLLDYYKNRKLDKKLILEKLPFFLLAFGFGIIAVLSQKERGAIQDLTPLYSVFERLFIVSHNIYAYIWKLFAPVNLAAMYPYPDRTAGLLPIMYYISLGFVAVLLFILFWSKKFGKDYIFGFLFFFITIALVLQILPVGGASIAERYTYIPYIGLFFIIGKLYDNSLTSKIKTIVSLKPLFHVILLCFVIFFSYSTWERIKVWKNGEILMTALIKNYPNLPFAYTNRGYYYYHWEKNFEKAMVDLNKAISLDPNNNEALSNRGVVNYNLGNYKESILDFNSSLKLKKSNVDALIGRANAYSQLHQFDLALPDYDEYMKYKTDDSKAYVWRGIAKINLNKQEEALVDFEKCLSINPNDDEAFYWKGLSFYNKKEYSTALPLLDKSIAMNPKRAEVYGWRGLTKYNLKQYNEAIPDFTKAIELNPNDASAYVNRSTAYFEVGKFPEAWEDINKAGKMGYPLNKEYFMKLYAIVSKK